MTIIGRGGFGKVWKIIDKKTKKKYAMKEMSKTKIIDKHSIKSVKNERNLLEKINHPFIINMHYSFQDKDNLYLIMDFLSGGDLRYHLCKKKKFTESQSKFFISNILLSLEYIHENKIIHRDIKPENLILDSKGYVHLTDFGISKIQSKNNSKETSGTPGYMSPEVMCGQNHTIAVDYFALGVMTYEFMKGYRPYIGRNRKEIKEKILMKEINIKYNKDYCNGWSYQSIDFINKLLVRKDKLRLGFNGCKDVMNHSWFYGFQWDKVYFKEVISDFLPGNYDNFDYKYCNGVEVCGLDTRERYAEIVISDIYKVCFDDYYFFDRKKCSLNMFYYNFHEEKFKKKINGFNNFNNDENYENCESDKGGIKIYEDIIKDNIIKDIDNFNFNDYDNNKNKNDNNNNFKFLINIHKDNNDNDNVENVIQDEKVNIIVNNINKKNCINKSINEFINNNLDSIENNENIKKENVNNENIIKENINNENFEKENINNENIIKEIINREYNKDKNINIEIENINYRKHNRVKSQLDNYSKYIKKSNKEIPNLSNNSILNQESKIENNNKSKKKSIHIRSTSELSLNSAKAFFEANNYIENRKLKRKKSVIIEKNLNKEISYQKFIINQIPKENIKGSYSSRISKIGNISIGNMNNNNNNKYTIGLSQNSTGLTYKYSNK